MRHRDYERGVRREIEWIDSLLALLAERAAACAGRRGEGARALLAELREARRGLDRRVAELAGKRGVDWEGSRLELDVRRIAVLQEFGRALGGGTGPSERSDRDDALHQARHEEEPPARAGQGVWRTGRELGPEGSARART